MKSTTPVIQKELPVVPLRKPMSKPPPSLLLAPKARKEPPAGNLARHKPSASLATTTTAPLPMFPSFDQEANISGLSMERDNSFECQSSFQLRKASDRGFAFPVPLGNARAATTKDALSNDHPVPSTGGAYADSHLSPSPFELSTDESSGLPLNIPPVSICPPRSHLSPRNSRDTGTSTCGAVFLPIQEDSMEDMDDLTSDHGHEQEALHSMQVDSSPAAQKPASVALAPREEPPSSPLSGRFLLSKRVDRTTFLLASDSTCYCARVARMQEELPTSSEEDCPTFDSLPMHVFLPTF